MLHIHYLLRPHMSCQFLYALYGRAILRLLVSMQEMDAVFVSRLPSSPLLSVPG
jgi:hypothetical protein